MRRMTSLRENIVKLISTRHLVSANEVLTLLEKEGYFVNKTTVYRALEYLVANNYVVKLAFQADEALFEIKGEHHDHTYCVSCKQIEKLSCVFAIPEKIHSFIVQDHHVTLFGLCKECRKKKQKSLLRSVIRV